MHACILNGNRNVLCFCQFLTANVFCTSHHYYKFFSHLLGNVVGGQSLYGVPPTCAVIEPPHTNQHFFIAAAYDIFANCEISRSRFFTLDVPWAYAYTTQCAIVKWRHHIIEVPCLSRSLIRTSDCATT